MLVGNNIIASNADNLAIFIGYGSTPTYITSGYNFTRVYGTSSASASTATYNNMYYAPMSATNATSVTTFITSNSNGVNFNSIQYVPTVALFILGANYPTATTISALKITSTGTSTLTGSFSIYGISS